MKTIVVSAVSLRKGGTLTIMRQCLDYLSQLSAEGGYRIIALVHRQDLADYPGIEYIELPWVITSWWKRLWCEYVTMNKISRELGEVDLWFSLHDTTPRVHAKSQAVYCQTSFPFYKWHLRDFKYDKKIPLFAMLTRFAYQIGIRKNKYLVVQQEWLREGFSRMFSLPQGKFIVAPPTMGFNRPQDFIPNKPYSEDKRFRFLFVATADSHKGFEVLAEASELLEKKVGKGRFQTIITLKGNENAYARDIYRKCGHLESLNFKGLLDKNMLYEEYLNADCLVFPSRIETWGLPISEYLSVHQGKRPVILTDLPYAHETSQGAELVAFFPNENVQELTQRMLECLEGDIQKNFRPNPLKEKQQPVAYSWEELFKILLS